MCGKLDTVAGALCQIRTKCALWQIAPRRTLYYWLVPRLFLIDSYGFIFRAFHARARTGAPPMRTSTGISTEVVFIFSNMLRKLTRTYAPAYMAAVFEGPGKTLREAEYADYKANRAETPDDLIQQIP